MSNIQINDCVYKVHPVYNLYASDENGNIIHVVKQVPYTGNKQKNGYLCHMVRKHGQNGQKGYYVHRFVYECFNGIIPDGKVIDHVTVGTSCLKIARRSRDWSPCWTRSFLGD